MSIEEIIPDKCNIAWQQVLSQLNNSLLDIDGIHKLEVLKVYKICNNVLEDSFKNKINEFVASGCNNVELESRIGFIVENDGKAISDLMQYGLSVRDSDNNTIGYNCMGVYLCKHLDVCLKHALAKMASVDHYKIIVCQYVTGKTTTAIPRAAVMGDFIEPTANFTSHISPIPASSRDSIQTQFDRSQVYLYELDDKMCPVITPRHILPMWVVVYGGGGAKMDVRGVGGMKGGKVEEGRGGQLNDRVLERVNAEMSQMVTSANNISNNLRLQRAINLINSKGVPEPPSKLQQAINNINNKGATPMDPYFDNMVDDHKLLQTIHLSSNNNLFSSSNHQLASQLNNHPSYNSSSNNHPSYNSDGLVSSLNLLSNDALYYCSDTNNILDVNSLLELANANHNIATILSFNQTPDLNPQQQQQHQQQQQQQQQDYYSLNYLNHSVKPFMQQSQQDLMFASSSASSSSFSASSAALQRKRGHNDATYQQLYDKKLRIV